MVPWGGCYSRSALVLLCLVILLCHSHQPGRMTVTGWRHGIIATQAVDTENYHKLIKSVKRLVYNNYSRDILIF